MDGMKCDEKGNLYICRYDKGTIALLNPQGNLVEEIQLTGKQADTIPGRSFRQNEKTAMATIWAYNTDRPFFLIIYSLMSQR